jgi:hypothetical protein
VSGVMQLYYTSFTVRGAVDGAAAVRGIRPTSVASPGVRGRVIERRSNEQGRIDVTDDVSFEGDPPSIDFTSKSIGFAVRVRNKSLSYIPGPFTLVLNKVESDFTGLTVANADNALGGQGAAWTLHTRREGLGPGDQSQKVEIRWRFDGRVPEPKNLLSQFVVHFKLLSEPTASARKGM